MTPINIVMDIVYLIGQRLIFPWVTPTAACSVGYTHGWVPSTATQFTNH